MNHAGITSDVTFFMYSSLEDGTLQADSHDHGDSRDDQRVDQIPVTLSSFGDARLIHPAWIWAGIGAMVTLIFLVAAPAAIMWVEKEATPRMVESRFNLLYPAADPTLWTPSACVPISIPVPHVEDMTLEEKLGQMTLVEQLAVTQSSPNHGDDITNYYIGAVLSGGGSVPVWGNTAPDWANLVDHVQSKAALTRLKIPILYGVDAVHGNNNLLGTTIFPHHVGLGATRNPDIVRKVAAAAARETAATGIRWAFAPAVSVCRDPRWGRCYESFSEETSVVTAVAAAEIEGWQTPSTDTSDAASSVSGDVFVAATAKHFIADGGTEGGIDRGNAEISEEELRRVHLPPYAEAVRKGVQSVMISFSSWNGVKMHGNRYLISDVLKGELGFPGVVVSDWAGIQRLPGNFSEQVRNSINAGLDLIMVPTAYKTFISTLREEVTAGRIPVTRINDAVTRILRMKQNLGLFENACAPRQLLKTVGSSDHRSVAREAVKQSLVLLKNTKRGGRGSMFPLPLDRQRVFVGGSHAHDIGLQCGGWTVAWQGGSGNVTAGTTILEGIQAAAQGKSLSVEYKRQPEGNEEADYGIVVVGESPYAESAGDDPFLKLDANSTLAIDTLCGKMPCVVVLITGRPLHVKFLMPKVDALVAAWLPGSEGAGVADVLFGEEDFRGRLPVSWFGDGVRPQANALEKPLFPFGFGLTKGGYALPMN